MAPICRFSMAEKGMAPREELDPLPPKKRLVPRGPDEGPEGADADRHGQRRRRRRQVTKVWVVPPGVHTEGSSREFVLRVAIPLQSWIRLPPFFASIIPQGEPLELWLQHAGCSTLATEAEVAVVAPGEIGRASCRERV